MIRFQIRIYDNLTDGALSLMYIQAFTTNIKLDAQNSMKKFKGKSKLQFCDSAQLKLSCYNFELMNKTFFLRKLICV